MNRKTILIVLFICTLCLMSCGKEEAKNIDLSQPAEKTEAGIPENAIRMGIAAVVSPKEGFLYYDEFLDYIGEKVSRPVFLRQGKYKEINDLLEYNEIDVAFVCSGAYIEAMEDSTVELLVVPVINGKPEYYSYIIVHKDSGIMNFADLEDRSFAFTDPLSNSGCLYPTFLHIMKGKNVREYLTRTIYTYSHDNSIIAVADKLVDAAAVDSLIYDWLSEVNPELIERTKIILKSPPFGIPPVVVSKKIDNDLKTSLKKVFLGLHKEQRGREILNKLRIDKFIETDDKMYDSIRIMKNKIVKSKS